MRTRWILPAMLLAGALWVAAATAGVPVCPKCGYENWQGGRQCEHCKAELPEVKTAGESLEQENPDCVLLDNGKLQFLKPSVVEAEIQLGNLYSATGEVDVARLFLRNAAALDMLTDPASKNDRAARIVDLLKKNELGRRTAQRQCPLCNGTGKSVVRMVSLKGEVSFPEIHGKPCQKCGGSGTVSGPVTVDDRKLAAGRAASGYAALQRSRKYVPEGGAWVPLAIGEKLSRRQVVLLRRAVSAPCPLCMGNGCVDCAQCKGTRDVKCTNPKCVQGTTQVEASAGLTKTKITRSEKCKVCGGKGMIACPGCNGTGSVLCKACNGTGELPLCKKCSGQGFSSCSKCNGTGTQKQVGCSTCGGEGITICSSCNGDGRKK